MRSSSEEGSYSRPLDFCITQLLAESNKEEEGGGVRIYSKNRWSLNPCERDRALLRVIPPLEELHAQVSRHPHLKGGQI